MMLQNACALVTGAGQGIGKEIALALAREGCAVAVNDLYAERASAVVAAIGAAGGKAVVAEGNVAVGDAVKSMVETTVVQLGKLDILVNNAGMILKTPFWDITEKDWDTIMAVNLKSVFLCCQAAAPYMKAQKSGKIINIASMLSFQGGIRVPSYTASKSGVLGITRLLANEWAQHGINVNAIAPGYMATSNTEALRDDVERNKAILERIPAGRWGTPDDLKGPVVFLASPASDYINGYTIAVDGGWLAR